MNFICPGNLSHVFSEASKFRKHLQTCTFVASSFPLFECKFHELHLFRSLNKKRKHEKMCTFKISKNVDPKNKPVYKYFKSQESSKLKLQIKSIQENKKKVQLKERLQKDIENNVQRKYKKNSRFFLINVKSLDLAILANFNNLSHRFVFKCLEQISLKTNQIIIDEYQDTKGYLNMLDEFYFLTDIYFENYDNYSDSRLFQEFWEYVKFRPYKLFSTDLNSRTNIYCKND